MKGQAHETWGLTKFRDGLNLHRLLGRNDKFTVRPSLLDEAVGRARIGVSPRAAVEDIAVSYGLDEAAIEQAIEEVEDALIGEVFDVG